MIKKKWEHLVILQIINTGGVYFRDGEEIYAKFWNSKGEPVDSLDEANK